AVVANHSGVLDPGVVALVVEIVSPGSRTTDRLTKPAIYARAGIEFYWRVELDEGPTIVAHRLHRGAYVEQASASAVERLVLDEPFPIALEPGDLRP
ncbi:MAG: Uma2 family endonuclease, partial [Acidimicrobiales bacterium]